MAHRVYPRTGTNLLAYGHEEGVWNMDRAASGVVIDAAMPLLMFHANLLLRCVRSCTREKKRGLANGGY